VIRYVGDGIMAFFGHPVAYYNQAEQAARARFSLSRRETSRLSSTCVGRQPTRLPR
jgi:hypothetical protein